MGNMTVTVVKRGGAVGGRQVVVADFTFSSSYATNGDTIQAADIANLLPEGYALTDVVLALFETASNGVDVYLDKTNKKVKAFNGTTEIANATNQSTVVVRGRLEFGFGLGSV